MRPTSGMLRLVLGLSLVLKKPEFALLAPLALAACILAVPRPSPAAAVSPRVVATARATSQAALLTQHVDRYQMSRAAGVDRIYPQFALNLAKFPRDGVAHRNILVVLCDFDGDEFGPAVYHSSESTPAYYDRLLFSDDPSDGIISLREYYRLNSHGRLIVSGRVTSDWLKMPHSYAYYVGSFSGLDFGSYPRSAQKLAEDAMVAGYNSFGQNLSFFDNDGPDGIPSSGDDDGYIDATIVIHPGQGAEVAPVIQESALLWSHEAGIRIYDGCTQPSSADCLPGMLLGSKRGFLYTMNAEYNYGPGDNANGTYFHEFGHTLGLADLYEFSSCGNAIGTGLGVYSLMSYGNYLPLYPPSALGTRPADLDAWSRQLLGFDQPAVVTTSGRHTLPPLTRGGSAFKVWKNGQPGTEYFLVENRIQEGPDEFLPGEGLLIYHVDDTLIDNCRDCDNASCSDPPAPHYRIGVVQADGLQELEAPSPSDYGDANDFFPGALGIRSWTQGTAPSTRDYAGADTGIRMTNIAGAYDSADTASFDLTISLAPDILVQSATVRDGGAGNSNGILDNAETDSLAVTLRNAGMASAGLNLTLSTSDPGVTILNGASTAPAAGAGATVAVGVPFVIMVGNYPTLPHPVVFTLNWSDGVTSGTETFTVTVGMGSGLSADFESGLGNWTSGPVAPSSVNEWHLSTTRAYGVSTTSVKVGSSLDPSGGGSNAAKTYANLEDAALVSPMFYLPPGSRMTFYSWIDAETNGGTMAFDGGRVEISVRGGAWEPLAVDGGYGYQVIFYSGATLRGADVFSGSPQSWRRVVADLSAYSGAVQIRFRFSTDERNAPIDFNSGQLARYYEGWYVDDVAVGNGAPTANPGGPYSGVAGVPVAVDGSSSSDPDGNSLRFDWDFENDGVYDATGARQTHTYAADGIYTVKLRVTDDAPPNPGVPALSDSATTTATIQSFFPARVFRIKTNRIQLYTDGQHHCFQIEPIGGDFTLTDVNLSTVVMKYGAIQVSAETRKTVIHADTDHNGIAEIQTCFSAAALRTLFVAVPIGVSTVTVGLEGDLTTGGRFHGDVTFKIQKDDNNQNASVSPNPLNPEATLTLFLPKAGFVRVKTYDLKGRLVRTLIEESHVTAGYHDVTIDGRGAGGEKLASGVYFYRVETVAGVTTGRFVITK